MHLNIPRSQISSRTVHKSQSAFRDTLAITGSRNSFKNLLKPSKSSLGAEEDVEVVENLEFWHYSKGNQCLTRMNTAREDLFRKLNNQDIVEANKLKRKGIEDSPNRPGKAKEHSKYFQNYENEVMALYKNTLNKLKKTTDKRDNKRKHILDLKDELNTVQHNLEMSKKLSKFSPRQQWSSKMSQLEAAIYLSKKKSMRVKPTDNEEMLQSIEMLEIKIAKNQKKLKKFEEKIIGIRSNLKVVKGNIIKNFLELLKEGKDLKGEGLYTLAMLLIKFDVDLKPGMFPKILDEISIDCIIKLAERHLELERIYDNLLAHSETKHTSIIKKQDIHERIAKITRTIKIRKPNYEEKKKKWQAEELLETYDDYLDTNISETLKNEERIRTLKNEISDLQKAEIKRLTKECTKAGKDLKQIATYIVGPDNLVKFNIIIMKEIQLMNKVKEKTKTFSFTSGSYNQYKLSSPR